MTFHDEFEGRPQGSGGRPSACFFTVHRAEEWDPEWVDTKFAERLGGDAWEDWYPGAVPAPFKDGVRFGVCAAEEGGETGAEHFQACVLLPKGKSASYSQWKELMAAVFDYPAEKVWTMRCKSIPAAIKYCSGKCRSTSTSTQWVDKPGVIRWAEVGEYDDKSGSRTDLVRMKELIDKKVLSGSKRRFEDIALGEGEDAEIAFMGLMKYSKGVQDYIDGGAMVKVRSERPEAEWYYGMSGAGKSYAARRAAVEFIKQRHVGMDEAEATTRIYYKPEGDWFTGYSNQKHDVVVIEELRPSKHDMAMLCKMVDENPFMVNRKSMREMPFDAGLVLVTSPMNPVEAFEGKLNSGDSLQQLSRRFGFRQFFIEVDDDNEVNRTSARMWYDVEHDMMSSAYTRQPARYPPIPE